MLRAPLHGVTLRGAPLLAIAALFFCGRARADDGANQAQIPAAQALFDEGRRLAEARNPAGACLKFEESQRLDPKLGTQLNIALCEEATGRTASAWTLYRAIEEIAQRDGDLKRAVFARMHAGALEPRLSRLAIDVSRGMNGATLTITRDGAVVGDAQRAIPIPVDHGKHVVVASAPGYRTWTRTVDVEADGEIVEVVIPPLDRETEGAAKSDVSPESSGAPAPAVSSASSSLGSRRIVALAIGGASLVAAGIGVAFGEEALARRRESSERCNGGCDSEGTRSNDDAKRNANFANVAFGTAIVGAGVGTFLFFTAGNAGARNDVLKAALRVAPHFGTANGVRAEWVF